MGYKFVNLSHNHVCPCVFGTIEEAFKDLHNLQKEGKVISYDIISKDFNIDNAIKIFIWIKRLKNEKC